MDAWIRNTLAGGEAGLAVLPAAFLLGLIGSVTPCCTLPVIGAVAGYACGLGERKQWRGLGIVALALATGTVLAFTVLGAAAGFIGRGAGATLGQSWRFACDTPSRQASTPWVRRKRGSRLRAGQLRAQLRSPARGARRPQRNPPTATTHPPTYGHASLGHAGVESALFRRAVPAIARRRGALSATARSNPDHRPLRRGARAGPARLARPPSSRPAWRRAPAFPRAKPRDRRAGRQPALTGPGPRACSGCRPPTRARPSSPESPSW